MQSASHVQMVQVRVTIHGVERDLRAHSDRMYLHMYIYIVSDIAYAQSSCF